MDITQASFSFSSLTGSYAQAAAREPAAGFASMMSHCAGKGCDTAKSASFSASIMNIDITSFSFESQSRHLDPLREFIDALFDHITGADKNGKKSDVAGADTYSFTSDFQSIFGNTGPLIDFINATTSRLGLSEEKNLALQQIAINNKDATRSRESINKIGAELKAAGIYA